MYRSVRRLGLSLPAIVALVAAAFVGLAAHAQTVRQLTSTGLSVAQHDVAVSPDGRFALVRAGAGADGVVFFRLSDGAEIGRFPMSTAPPSVVIIAARSLAVSPDGEWAIATGGAGADAVTIFDTRGAAPQVAGRFALSTHAHDVAISADGSFGVVRSGAMVGPSLDGVTFYRFDRGTGTALRVAAHATFTAPAGVRSVAISPDGARTVTLGGAGASAILIFGAPGAMPTERQLFTAPHDLAISPDGRFAVVRSGGSLNGIAFVDLATGSLPVDAFATVSAPLYPPAGSSNSVAISPDGRRVVVLGAAAPDSVAIFEAAGSTPVELSRSALASAPHDVVITPDSRFAVVRAGAGVDGIVAFDLVDGSRRTSIAPATAPAFGSAVDSLAAAARRAVVLGGAGGGELVFLDTAATHPALVARQALSTAGLDVAVDPGGAYAVVREAQRVAFHRLSDGALLADFAPLTAPAATAGEAVAVSPDGRRVVTIGGAGSVDVFAVSPPLGPFAEIERVSVADDGRQSDGSNLSPALSGDGRHVAFLSSATDLVAQPELHSFFGVYVRDTGGEGTEQINVGLGGLIGPSRAALSADGRYVAFLALVGGCLTPSVFPLTPLCVYVRDRVTGTSELISVAGDGTPGNAGAFSPAISAGGRYVAFTSGATNLAPGTADAVVRVFLRDRAAGTTELVSVGAGGAPANGASFSPAVSADGCVVVFASEATNLAAGADTPLRRVYVRDRCAGTTEAVSVDFAGRPDHGDEPSISADGRFVAFVSEIPLTGLILDFDGPRVFVRDRLAGTTELGHFAIARQPAISSDGGWLAFRSSSADIVPGVGAGRFHVYVRERASGETSLASHAATGEPGDADSAQPSLALRAAAVAFESASTNLVAGDTNGADDVFVARRVPAPGAEQPAANVALLPNLVDAREVRVESPPGTRLADVRSVGYPSFDGAPATVSFPAGFLAFQVEDLGAGAATTVELHLPPGVEPTTYWKHGPTPDDPAPHWYEFLFDGETGAVLAGDRVTLHFVDGRRGDDDLVADGVVRDAGGPAAPPAGPTPECVADATTLCLNGGRFAVETDWAAPQGTSGPGRAEPLTDDTGTFWFFDPDNVEVVIKVLDACGPFDRFWVFAGGLTDVATEIRVTDTVAGVVRTFRNPQGTAFQPIQATDAFATCAAGSAVRASAREVARAGRRRQPLTTVPLRLADERFEVFVTWRTSRGTSGSGQPERLTGDSGTFWFFDPDNVEVVIKVLDACGPFDRFWVFAAGLTDVEVEITVLDTDTDTPRVYRNPLGVPFQPLQDTGAFATCP